MGNTEGTRLSRPKAALTFVAGTCLSILIGVGLQINALHQRTTSFETHVDRKTAELQQTINQYAISLRNTASMITAVGDANLTPEVFRTYVETLNLREHFPGALGLGFVRKVSIESEGRFVQSMRQKGMEDFEILFIRPSKQDRFVIQYMEPLAENRAALGLDLGSESIRRENCMSAFARAGLAVSKPVTMIQNAQVGRIGFNMLMPVFQTSQPSKDIGLRYEELLGWVSFPVSIDRFLNNWLETNRYLPVRISVIDSTDKPQLFLDNVSTRMAIQQPDASESRVIQLGNRRWRVDFWPAHPQHSQGLNWVYAAIVLLGIALSALVARRVKTGLDRQSSQILYEHLVDTSSDALVAEDASGRIVIWNKSAEQLFGHDRLSVLNDLEQNLSVPAELLSAEKRLRQRATEGEVLREIQTQRINDAAQTLNLKMNLTPVYMAGNKLVGFTKSYRDETETRQVWQELNALEELISHAPDGVVLLDQSRTVKLANPSALLLLQGAQLNSTLIGQRMTDLLGPEALLQFENEVLHPLYKNNRVEVVFNWPLPNNMGHVALLFRGFSLGSAESGDAAYALRFDKNKPTVHHY